MSSDDDDDRVGMLGARTIEVAVAVACPDGAGGPRTGSDPCRNPP